jgi:hexokinase
MNIKQLRIIQSNFIHELQDAQDGKKTSLPFIVHEIPSSSLVKEGELFEVLVIGGSIWKKAILQKTKTGIGIIKKETERSVDFKNEKDFLEFIDNEAKDNIQVLALNFAYPLKPIFKNGRLDGKLLAVSKERSFHGLIGKKIGFEIEKYILEKRKKSREAGSRFARKIIVSLANDTICLLLSGLIKYSFDSLAAGIVGTGLNFAFFLNKNRLVNLESANFDKFPKTAEGQIIDKESNNPHGWVFEKETAGAYLYKHFNILIKDRKID